ncbi:MAG: sulfatase-like hydrolase/transferase [Bacteroidaceae bacterium]|nr:sulfatase-like hydrolase/transferase [Bacteroidaceae bacterium]
MKHFLDIIFKPIREQKVLFWFLILMSCVVIPVMCYATGAFPKPFVFAPPIFDCYLLTVLAYFLRRIHLSWLVWIACILLLGGEVFSILCYQSPYSMTVLQLILETNGREATEFLKGHGVAGQLASATGITFGAIFISWLLFKSPSKHTPSPLRGTPPNSWGEFLGAALLLLSASCQGYSYFRLYQAYTAEVTTTIAENKYMPLRNSPFIRFFYGHALNVVSTKELAKLEATVERTEVDSCSYRSPIILFLLGESFNKYHSPLYNSKARQTTPNLCRLKEQGNLIVFDDAVSPYNVTSKTLRYMFSTYYPGCGRAWVDCTLFPAVFRKAGYDVWFITNQFAGEANNRDHHGHAGGTIFNQKELRQQQFTYMNPEATKYDMDLLADLPLADELAAKPSLLIFHMMGQHEDYRERYPEAFNHFTADSVQNDFTDDNGRQIVAEYDNATLYNDAVVAKLLEKYAEKDVVAIYMPDHGEEVYDWRNSCYRTNSDQMTPEIARYQYEIPMLFYVSDSFKTNHPDLLADIVAAQHKSFISTMLPFALFHLAGITHADYKPELDILSPLYDEECPRIIREDVDYDELMGKKEE